MGNLDIYNTLKQPPKEALRTIEAGRLRGKTDINPQWRYMAMTEQFGPCGVGWKYGVTQVWNEPAGDGQIFAFATINLFYKIGDVWSDPIPGLGGSMLVEKEKAGLHANDEGYKMAITDALSTAMKMLGVAADIYAGLWDGTKYRVETTVVKPTTTVVKDTAEPITPAQMKKLGILGKEKGIDKTRAYMSEHFGGKTSRKQLTKDEASQLIEYLDQQDDYLVDAAKEMGAEEE